jgi:hypothetical protein
MVKSNWTLKLDQDGENWIPTGITEDELIQLSMQPPESHANVRRIICERSCQWFMTLHEGQTMVSFNEARTLKAGLTNKSGWEMLNMES